VVEINLRRASGADKRLWVSKVLLKLKSGVVAYSVGNTVHNTTRYSGVSQTVFRGIPKLSQASAREYRPIWTNSCYNAFVVTALWLTLHIASLLIEVTVYRLMEKIKHYQSRNRQAA
jgi:hypothetical protein